jgi:glycine/D-amino acid oxidase-like deaminating enzyme
MLNARRIACYYQVGAGVSIHSCNASSKILLKKISTSWSSAAVAYEAATRGFSVALVEMGDFGAATSAATSRLTASGRPIYIIPWRGHSLIGTTDREYAGDPDEYRVTREKIAEFIGEINSGLDDGYHLEYSDVEYAYGGLGTLGNPGGDVLERVAQVAAAELNWSDARTSQELETARATLAVPAWDSNSRNSLLANGPNTRYTFP